MKSRFVSLAVVAAMILLGPVTARTELWILSGQSNGAGWALLPGLPPDPKVLMFDYAEKKWVPAQDPLPCMSSRGVGAWIAAAQAVTKEGVPAIKLVGAAMPGAPIAYWNDGGKGMADLTNAVKACGEKGDVFLWYQGESDSQLGTKVEEYEAKLRELVARVRKVADNPAMAVVVIQLSGWGCGGDPMIIREAQRRFVISDTNAILVAAIGLSDGEHLSKDNYYKLGQEISRALLKVRYGSKTANWPGPVMDAAALSADSRSATAHFAEVKKLQGCGASDFGAVDAAGPVKCENVQATNTLVHLTFERPLKLPAKLIYGFGRDPKATLMDEAGNRAPAVQLDLTPGASLEDKESLAPNGAGGIK